MPIYLLDWKRHGFRKGEGSVSTKLMPSECFLVIRHAASLSTGTCNIANIKAWKGLRGTSDGFSFVFSILWESSVFFLNSDFKRK